MLAGIVDCVQILSLQIIDRAVDALQDYTREADDRVQRGAQFMAHVGQELALDAIDFAHVLNRFL